MSSLPHDLEVLVLQLLKHPEDRLTIHAIADFMDQDLGRGDEAEFIRSLLLVRSVTRRQIGVVEGQPIYESDDPITFLGRFLKDYPETHYTITAETTSLSDDAVEDILLRIDQYRWSPSLTEHRALYKRAMMVLDLLGVRCDLFTKELEDHEPRGAAQPR